MKYKLTCNDAVVAMVREDVIVDADDLDEAFEKAKRKFCNKHKTKKRWVNVTAVQHV